MDTHDGIVAAERIETRPIEKTDFDERAVQRQRGVTFREDKSIAVRVAGAADAQVLINGAQDLDDAQARANMADVRAPGLFEHGEADGHWIDRPLAGENGVDRPLGGGQVRLRKIHQSLIGWSWGLL